MGLVEAGEQPDPRTSSALCPGRPDHEARSAGRGSAARVPRRGSTAGRGGPHTGGVGRRDRPGHHVRRQQLGRHRRPARRAHASRRTSGSTSSPTSSSSTAEMTPDELAAFAAHPRDRRARATTSWSTTSRSRRTAARCTSRGPASATHPRSTSRPARQLWHSEVDGLPLRPHGALAGRPRAARVGDDRERRRRARHRRRHDHRRRSRPATSRTRTSTRTTGRSSSTASIGRVIAPDDPMLDAAKGNRWSHRRRRDTKAVLKQIDFGVGIRPFVVMPDNRTLYVQLSFHHGFVEFDLAEERITREVHLPLSDEAEQMQREDYPLDSAHHGLALGARLLEALRRGHGLGLRRHRLASLADHRRDRAGWRQALLGGCRPPTGRIASCPTATATTSRSCRSTSRARSRASRSATTRSGCGRTRCRPRS